MFYMLITPWLSRALAPVLARGREDGSGRPEALVLLLVTALSGLGLKLVGKLGLSLPYYDQYAGVLEPAFGNLPFFVLGILMRRSRVVFALVHSRPWLWAACAAVLLGARYSAEQVAIQSTVEHLAHLGVDFATSFTCSFALLGFAQRLIVGPRRWVNLVSESAYTVYIVHYLVIAWALVLAQRWGLGIPVRAAGAALLATGVGLLVHVGLVRRVRLAALLLNGRLPDAPTLAPELGAHAPPASSAAPAERAAFALANSHVTAAVETATNARGESRPDVLAPQVASPSSVLR